MLAAISYESISIVRLLLEFETLVDLGDFEEAITLAITSGNVNILELLAENSYRWSTAQIPFRFLTTSSMPHDDSADSSSWNPVITISYRRRQEFHPSWTSDTSQRLFSKFQGSSNTPKLNGFEVGPENWSLFYNASTFTSSSTTDSPNTAATVQNVHDISPSPTYQALPIRPRNDRMEQFHKRIKWIFQCHCFDSVSSFGEFLKHVTAEHHFPMILSKARLDWKIAEQIPSRAYWSESTRQWRMQLEHMMAESPSDAYRMRSVLIKHNLTPQWGSKRLTVEISEDLLDRTKIAWGNVFENDHVGGLYL